jgi:hypothetical protein
MDVCFVASAGLRCDMEYVMTALGVARVIKSKSRMNLANTLPFVRTLLSVALMSAVVMPAYALEAMSDASLSGETGEGLAFFTNNFQFQMPSVAGDVSQSGTPAYGNFYGAGTNVFGTGPAAITPGNYGSYVYLSPLGSVPTGGNRTDVYLYGLSLSENDNTSVTTSAGTACTATNGCIAAGSVVAPADALHGTVAHNILFNPTLGVGAGGGGINWGSATDPFTLSVFTTNTPQAPAGYTTSVPGLGGGLPQVPFLRLTAPTSALPSTDSSNNLRLGLWMNILQEDMTSLATQQLGGNNSLTASGTAGPALQIQALWDGFGINGTTIDLFPTDPCTAAGDTCVANPAGAVNKGNSAYSNTLGFAGVLRFNSQTTGVLRLSVGGTGTTTANYGVFDKYEGLYLQQVNINLPLGNVNYQPLILSSGVTAFGTTGVSPTITLELAQIPNVASVYNKFYINYDPACTVSGSSCTSASGNAYGNPAGTVGLTPSAGMCSSGFGSVTACPATATHGNISIGNVYVNTSGVKQTAPNGDVIYAGEADANYIFGGATPTTLATSGNTTGVSFKAPDGSNGFTGAAVNLGNAAISGLAINHMKMTLTGL